VNERRAIPEDEVGHKYETKTGYFLKFKVSRKKTKIRAKINHDNPRIWKKKAG